VEHEANQRQIDEVEVPDDLETTDDFDVIRAAIDDINVADLAADIGEKTATTETNDSKDAIRFDPRGGPPTAGRAATPTGGSSST